ncbi:biogenesis of lysosome-related organelles complex 1 subunit 1 [Chiloscyllium plagiosum]|uniref:biogenesis of lysosome-related organelles complex 1 subunit 1 n=1 Tax=Chiloscyllium plagiosum TaxID=36176 RepID=UPI001CB80961|nr:biogenesis of lysosome-related organelles complex 1 subunit 1 [Chiloscyllium plagiosum]
MIRTVLSPRARSGSEFHARYLRCVSLYRNFSGVMLSRLLKDHQAKQNERKEIQEKRRREAVAAATRLTEALVDHLNVGVAQAYVNQRKLDNEVKTLQIQAAQFAKQTQQWLGMVDNFNQALKEIGDVENWARSIEMDMRTIATALEYVYKGQLQPAT